MIKNLINPFQYIAGLRSLILGLVIILATAIIGYYSNTHFPGIISVKTCPDFSMWYFVIQGFLNWLVISTLFYLISFFVTKSSVRAIDIYGTQALARFPYLIASFFGFSDALNHFSNYLNWSLLKHGNPLDISSIQIVIAVLIIISTLLLTIWMIALMFNALKVSANLKGNKLVFTFISVLLLALIVSGYLNQSITLKLQ